jgi:hypothetical protein
MEKFRATLRSVPAYKQWFEFAEDLNSLGLQMLDGLNVTLNDNQRLTIAALFVRAHKSLQATILLSERGLVGDARTVLRSAVEGAIASNALANDAQFLDQLIEAHHFNQRKKARLVLNNPDYRAIYSAKQIAEMERTIKDVDAIEAAAGRKLLDVTWSTVAAKHCKDSYDTLYRVLSSDGTHTTSDSINRMFDNDPSSKLITALKTGPDISNLVETIKAACLMFLWAADPFARAYNQTAIHDRLQQMLPRFVALPQDEPDASVVPRFNG